MPSKRRSESLPEWAGFLLRELPNLDDLPVKRLRTLARKAHLSAGGGKSDLVSKLIDFTSLEEPPDWFVEQKRIQNLLVEICDNDRSICLKIGQFLKIVNISRKMTGQDIQIEHAVPADCVKLHGRHSPGLPVGCSGHSKQIVKIMAMRPGTANLVYLRRSGATSDMKPYRTVQITVISNIK
jgi:hypothetical protein